jgi:hypothetical protein
MALSKDDLRIGNTVYKLAFNNNITGRANRITMIDSNGTEWYRRDREMWTYKVTAMTICGSVKQVICGVVNSDSVSEDEYHLSYVQIDWQSGVIEPYCESDLINGDLNFSIFFANEDQAIAAGETIYVNRNT